MGEENVFSDKQQNLIKIFKKLSEKLKKYEIHYFYLLNFKVTENKIIELENILEEARNNIEIFNKDFDANLDIVNYKLQKLKTSKMEKIDMMKEIEEISILVEKMGNK